MTTDEDKKAAEEHAGGDSALAKVREFSFLAGIAHARKEARKQEHEEFVREAMIHGLSLVVAVAHADQFFEWKDRQK